MEFTVSHREALKIHGHVARDAHMAPQWPSSVLRGYNPCSDLAVNVGVRVVHSDMELILVSVAGSQ